MWGEGGRCGEMWGAAVGGQHRVEVGRAHLRGGDGALAHGQRALEVRADELVRVRVRIRVRIRVRVRVRVGVRVRVRVRVRP